MAPTRGKGKAAVKAAAGSSTRRGTRSTRSRAPVQDDVPDVYRDMLREAGSDTHEESDRPVKRRKVASSVTTEPKEPSQASGPSHNPNKPIEDSIPPQPGLQTVEESSEDDTSDLEFEDVDFGGPSEAEHDTADGIEDLTISVQPESSKKPTTPARRKPATFAEKAHRLLVHKLHVLCLLGHCMYVNGRCNNAVVQRHLRPLLTAKDVSYLNPKKSETQFQRNRSFMDGLQQALNVFNAGFRVTGGGMTKARWDVDGESNRKYDPPPPMDLSDFVTAAKDLEGTQDTANQLFCALLRSVNVESRIVCSLQVLPFTSVPKASTPKKPAKEIIFAMAPDTPRPSADAQDSAVKESASLGKVPSARRRLGPPTFAAEEQRATPTKKRIRPVPKLSHPVFWVEAFNAAHQKWIPVDPLVTKTVNKAVKLEPSITYELNQMVYVIALEENGVARDVTKRYAKAYNAKTRRHRVEASAEGTKWFKKATRIFRRRGALDRGQVEDAELAQKEAREGMPANVLDFKDHPYYALERHLKRHEVLYPRREVGKVNAGTAAKPRMEPVFRRQDVLLCKSADKWYRLGREIKEAEQSVKRVPARAKRQRSVDPDDADGAGTETALYAANQTQLYVPPPVQRGRIPKNAFGNLDIYVPSMVPAGGTHIRHQLAQQAAKLLRVDYADAVTGFKFQGRHGTAIMEGVVVAEQYADAVTAVIEGFEHQMVEDESRLRSVEALKTWKKFLAGLRIKERVSTYGRDEEVDEDKEAVESNDAFFSAPVVDDNPLITAGQYTLHELLAPSRKPKAKKRKVTEDSEDEWGPRDKEPLYDADAEMDDPGLADGFLQTDSVANPVEYGNVGGFVAADDEEGGGFVVDDVHMSGGGFIPEDDGVDREPMPVEDLEGGFLPDAEEDGDCGDFRADTEADKASGGFLPDAPNDEALSGEGDARQTHQSDAPASDIDHPSDVERPEVIHTAPTGSPNPPIDETAANPGEPQRYASDSEEDNDRDDNDSMPSHDPEDDDAEPDWLESD